MTGATRRDLGRGALALGLGLPLIGRARAQSNSMSHEPDMMGRQVAPLPDAAIGSIVTRWYLVADRLNYGRASPQTTAMMGIAMHDALNAVTPRFRRWFAAEPDEPAVGAADAIGALSMAAFRTLGPYNQPDALRANAQPLLLEVLRALPPPAQAASLALGGAIGDAILKRHGADVPVKAFPESMVPGRWRATTPPPAIGLIAETKPFLFDSRTALHGPPPPALGSAHFLRDLDEVRRLGALDSVDRTPEQTEIALFWAAQSGQRGFLYLAKRLMEQNPAANGVWDEAWLLSMISVALADSATFAWEEKRAHSGWRPITAIGLGSPGAPPPDLNWRPLLETPLHPDYPSGHATDGAAGAGVLAGVFGADYGPVAYQAMEPIEQPIRRFANFAAITAECSQSRVYAGAHFRFANEEGERIGHAVAAKALERVAPL